MPSDKFGAMNIISIFKMRFRGVYKFYSTMEKIEKKIVLDWRITRFFILFFALIIILFIFVDVGNVANFEYYYDKLDDDDANYSPIETDNRQLHDAIFGGRPVNDRKPWKPKLTKLLQTVIRKYKKGDYLCISEKNKLFECTVMKSSNFACFDELSGIVACGFFGVRPELLTVCKEETSKKIITCGNDKRTNLCFPTLNDAKINFNIEPCSEENRFLCLIEDGSLSKCSHSKESADSAGRADWITFWSEWQPLNNGSTEGKSGMEMAALCMDSQNETVQCDSQMVSQGLEMCVEVVSGDVGVCKEMNETTDLVHLCVEASTQEIVTCGNVVVANLCFPGTGKLTPLRPCLSETRRVCLKNNVSLGHCWNETENLVFPFETKATATVNYTNEEKIIIENQPKGLVQLCKNDFEDRVYQCDENSVLFVACLGVKDGSIKTCYQIENKEEFGIPVCIQEKTSYLFSCEMYSQSNLCLHPSAQNSSLSHCTISSRFACVTGEGSLEFCTSLEEHENKGNISNVNLNYTLPMKYNPLELKLRSVVNICKLNEENGLVECPDDASAEVSCLNLEDGNISSCQSVEYPDLSIPVCVMGSKKVVVTCGKFNLVPICQAAERESSKYTACGSAKNVVCLRNGSIQSCGISGSQGIKEHSIATRAAPQKILSMKNETNFKNERRVYMAESKVISSMMRFRERLCLKEGRYDQYAVCKEETERLACLSPTAGTVKKCVDCDQNIELGVPLCVKKSNEVTTCGKFSKNPLCLYDILDGTLMTGCTRDGVRACLSNTGGIEACFTVKKDQAIENKDRGASQQLLEYVDKKGDGSQRQPIRDKILKMMNASHTNNIMLCIKGDNPMTLVNCDEDPALNFACLGAVQGSVRKCSSYKEDFPIAVCARVKSQHFVSCDIANRAHLCHGKKMTSSYIFPCIEPEQYSCVTKDGLLTRCTMEREPMFMTDGGGRSKGLPPSVNPKIEPIVRTRGPDEYPYYYKPRERGYDGKDVLPMKMAMDLDAFEANPSIVTLSNVEFMKLSPTKETPESGGTDEKFFRFHCNNCSIHHKFVIVGTPDDVLPVAEIFTFPPEG